MDQAQVIALMRKQQGERLAKDYAEELGISASYLSDIYKGKREPGATVLERLGLKKKAGYVPVEKSA
jgi:transcriptional regulator with XRE-family HTH domain